MRIYTRTGDQGETGLVGGERISKADLRMAAIGEIDELNAALGLARLHSAGAEVDDLLAQLAHWLFDLGAELASPTLDNPAFRTLSEAHVRALEQSMDRQTAALPPLREFILPGGSPAAASLHLARCICRRAERTLTGLRDVEEVRPVALTFVNRLSDWLFTAARTANATVGLADITWKKTETPV